MAQQVSLLKMQRKLDGFFNKTTVEQAHKQELAYCEEQDETSIFDGGSSSTTYIVATGPEIMSPNKRRRVATKLRKKSALEDMVAHRKGTGIKLDRHHRQDLLREKEVQFLHKMMGVLDPTPHHTKDPNFINELTIDDSSVGMQRAMKQVAPAGRLKNRFRPDKESTSPCQPITAKAAKRKRRIIEEDEDREESGTL